MRKPVASIENTRFVMLVAFVVLTAIQVMLAGPVLAILESPGTPIFLLFTLSMLLSAAALIGVYVVHRAFLQSHAKGELSARQARFLAECDPLTGLLNRNGFRARAATLLAHCDAEGTRACLVQYDANNLKSINDLYGHPTGDRCLINIAQQIDATFPDTALKARLGSDEFAVLIEESGLPKTIGSLKAQAIDSAAKDLAVSTTVGFAFYPDDGATMHQLMKAADLALISAKALANDSVLAFSTHMNESFRKRAWEIQGMREAIEQGEVVPYYQPLINANTLELESLETLIRWNHRELGVLSPGSFESALTEPAVAVAMTEKVLDLMLVDLKNWWSEGYRFSAGLNVGEYDLRNANFSDMIYKKLARHRLPPNALTIEVTESAVNAANVRSVIPILQSLRDRGFSVALDDFGTGTSSLTLLRSLPRTAIKIDKSFISDSVHDTEDRAIVEALAKLGRDLNIKVVAEGVETEEQVSFLKGLGVQTFQGFLFGKPQPASAISQNLRNWTVATPNRPRSVPPLISNEVADEKPPRLN
ncbi:MAG: bifunctional diguanylate cyclase/phosphodiesterase [Pseudomonadota bacterium]